MNPTTLPVSPSASPQGVLPVLYRNPVPVSTERHGDKSLREISNFAFARIAGAVPVTVSEFSTVCRFYPIVFTDVKDPNAMVVLGLRGNENLFVDERGSWTQGRYVPAYVRRYPFIFAEHPGGGKLSLCIDEGSGLVEPGAARPLYKDAKPTTMLSNSLKFATDYQRDWNLTRAFAADLAKLDLLMPYRARIRLASEKAAEVAGFLIIDEKRLQNLTDAQHLALRRSNWLPLIYAHMFSMQAWQDLIDRTNRQTAPVGAPAPA